MTTLPTAKRVVVVTGDLKLAGQSIQTLLAQGASVVVGGVDLEEADNVVGDSIASIDDPKIAFQFADLASPDDIRRLYRRTATVRGAVDIWLHFIESDVGESSDSYLPTFGSLIDRICRFLSTVVDESSHAGRPLQFLPVLSAGLHETPSHQNRLTALSAVVAELQNATTQSGTRVNLLSATRPGQNAATTPSVEGLLSGLAAEQYELEPGQIYAVTATTGQADDVDVRIDESIKKRLASAGFQPHDISRRYWQQPFRDHYPNLNRFPLQVTSSRQRTVVVTGASRGLGRSLVRELARLGHRVIGCARSPSSVNEVQAELGDRHFIRSVDVTNDNDVANWANEAIAEAGVPDLILNNAAVTNDSKQLWRFREDELETLLKINVLGPTNVLRHFLPSMIRNRDGVIVNFSSGLGRMASEKSGPYCASKWAIEGMTLCLADELPPQLTAVTLHPGNIQTDTMAASFGESADLYPTPEQWAFLAVPFLLSIDREDNRRQLSVPGMTAFRGIGPLVPATGLG